jgi:hypothetical protein
MLYRPYQTNLEADGADSWGVWIGQGFAFLRLFTSPIFVSNMLFSATL